MAGITHLFFSQALIVEVTEDEIIRDPQAIRELSTRLKLYGVGISIDDFGTAYSSLARLRDLPFIELKLDRSFVSGCSEGHKHALCRTAIDLAREFGASACAEGVEDARDLEALVSMGCDTAQGFLFAKPMSAAELIKMLDAPAHQRKLPVFSELTSASAHGSTA